MLIHGSQRRQVRILTLAALAFVAFCVTAIPVATTLNGMSRHSDDVLALTIDTPYVGQGVRADTDVVMHGVKVGKVTDIVSRPNGGVRVDVDLKKSAVAGMTNAMTVDFRPINYFGTPGINIAAGAGGEPLRSGTVITTVPKGNHTLQALLARLGAVSQGALTPQLVQAIERATRYTDGLTPLIETLFTAANAVAEVQTVSTARLLTNTAGLSVAFPSFVDSLMDVGWNYLHVDQNFIHTSHSDLTREQWQNLYVAAVEQASNDLFAAIGRVELSHIPDLKPVIELVKSVTDVVPPFIRPEGFGEMLTDLRTRFEKMYEGTPDRRAMRIKLILDDFPGVQAPVNAIGGP